MLQLTSQRTLHDTSTYPFPIQQSSAPNAAVKGNEMAFHKVEPLCIHGKKRLAKESSYTGPVARCDTE